MSRHDVIDVCVALAKDNFVDLIYDYENASILNPTIKINFNDYKDFETFLEKLLNALNTNKCMCMCSKVSPPSATNYSAARILCIIDADGGVVTVDAYVLQHNKRG